MPVADHIGRRPSGIPSPHSGARHNRLPSGLDGPQQHTARKALLMGRRENRPLASPAAAPAPRAATRPPRRRQAWLRIFVVGCSLPCDPPVGGHSCNGGMIARFHRAVWGLTALRAGGRPEILAARFFYTFRKKPFVTKPARCDLSTVQALVHTYRLHFCLGPRPTFFCNPLNAFDTRTCSLSSHGHARVSVTGLSSPRRRVG